MVSAGSTLLSKKARSPPKATAESSAKSSNSTQQSSETTSLPDRSEVERLREAAATELTTEEVKPIQTDFHFFVKENIDKYRKLAEEEVRSSLKDNEEENLDPLLVNSNLNTRLMKAWEGLAKDDRDAYMVHEEADRRRFMEDDEIASRHCATLTARGKSPKIAGGESNTKGQPSKIKKESQDASIKKDAEKETDKEELAGEILESPSKKIKAI